AGQRPANSEPTVEWYQELSRTLGIEDRVTWLIRHVEDKEIPEIFNCVDLAVLPYMKSFEAQSSVLSIAAAYDVPVIASDVANIGETVREFELGLCVESESAEQLAEGLRTLAITPRSSNTSAQRFARISNWTEVGRQYWLLYRDQLHSLGKGENT
ncbi:MAG TPA: glycosyltransferase, partial [Pyrinomonadaceae bacterium]|nr:glycosyltransferase [Pyrinomonadaceae bacterium]